MTPIPFLSLKDATAELREVADSVRSFFGAR